MKCASIIRQDNSNINDYNYFFYNFKQQVVLFSVTLYDKFLYETFPVRRKLFATRKQNIIKYSVTNSKSVCCLRHY